MRSAPATHGRHTPPQPPLKGEGDHEVVEGFNKQERWRGHSEKGGGPRSGGGIPMKNTPRLSLP